MCVNLLKGRGREKEREKRREKRRKRRRESDKEIEKEEKREIGIERKREKQRKRDHVPFAGDTAGLHLSANNVCVSGAVDCHS